MDLFGLGILLSVTDNASSEINSFTQLLANLQGRLDNLSGVELNTLALGLGAMGSSLNAFGDTVSNLGMKITSSFVGMVNSVVNVGKEIAMSRITLNKLFEDVKGGGEGAFSWAKDFAKTSMFNFKDLLPAMQSMKAVGIDVRDEIKTSTGEAQNLMEIAADIATIFPNARNSYGTGIKGAMGMLKEYISEGNALTLKRSAGLDIKGILGEDKGKTIEERARQVADLTKKIGAWNMAKASAGTPMMMLSNIEDTFFNLMTDIADSGVYEKFASIIKIIADAIFAIPDKDLKIIARGIGDAFVMLMTPIEWVAKGLAKAIEMISKFAKEHPQIFKIISALGILVGVSLIVVGSLLKVAGSVALLLASFIMLKSFIPTLGVGFKGLSTILMGLVSKLLLVGLVVGALYLIWTNNMFGIRDTVQQVVQDVINIFKLLVDAIVDNEMSLENFELAEKLGLLPFIETVLMAKYYFGIFAEGVQEGFMLVWDFLMSVGKNIEPLFVPINDVLNMLGISLSNLFPVGEEEKWKAFGKNIGILIGIVLPAIAIFKLLGVAITFLMSPIGLVIGAVVLFSVAWNKNWGNIRQVLADFIVRAVDLMRVFGDVFGGIVNTIVENIRSAWNGWLGDLVNSLVNFVTTLFSLVGQIGSILLPIVGFIAQIIFAVVGWALPIIGAGITGIINIFTGLLEAVGRIINGIVEVIQGFCMIFQGIISGDLSMIGEGFKMIFQGIGDFVSGLFTGIVNTITGAINTVIEAINSIQIPDWVPGIGGAKANIPTIPKLSTGGEIKGEGMSILHPNEVVVNSELTNGLRAFLIDYRKVGRDNLSYNVGADRSNVDSERKYFNIDRVRPSESIDNSTSNVDNSVVFNEGSIVINVANASSNDAENLAEMIMERIARKQQLNAMAVREG